MREIKEIERKREIREIEREIRKRGANRRDTGRLKVEGYILKMMGKASRE